MLMQNFGNILKKDLALVRFDFRYLHFKVVLARVLF